MSKPIYLMLPVGAAHGWGICGKYVARELAAMTSVRLLTRPFTPESIGDDLDYHLLAGLLPNEQELAELDKPGVITLDSLALQSIVGKQFLPARPNVKAKFTVGYAFFEDDVLPSASIQNARLHFDVVATGSTWCTQVLRQSGLDDVATVIQGVDGKLFNPSNAEKEYFPGQFVVFSGGKFELRKGQDIVIRACKVLQDRHKDVMLINSWFNPWQVSLNTMRASRHIRFTPAGTDHAAMINRVLADNGMDPSRTITLRRQANAFMPRIYKNTDIGLFPNRCEGGTNLVLMEYMACGKPVIASDSTGHKDVLHASNSIRIEQMRPFALKRGERTVAIWDDPDLDETIAHLEWAYQNRDQLGAIGTRAGQDMTRFTWKKTAQAFYKLLTGELPIGSS